MPTFAHYHQPGKEPQLLEVTTTHADGTVNLASNGTLIVTGCPVSDSPQPGHAVLQVAVKAAKEPKSAKAPKGTQVSPPTGDPAKDSALTTQATAAELRAAAVAAAELAKGNPDNLVLQEEAETAEAAAAAAEAEAASAAT